MTQIKISFEENQIEFIKKYFELGFKDKSSIVRKAIDEFRKSLEKKNLMRSANLYAEIYEQDEDLKDLTNSSIEDWPE
jgi:hypothetical protein